MSYILDALRKSEQQRQLAETPSLYTAQIIADAESSPPRLVYGALAALLIGCGVLIGWWRPWQHDNGAGDRAAPAAVEPASPAIAPAPPAIAPAPPPSTPSLPEPPSPRKFVSMPPVREVIASTPPLHASDQGDAHPRAATSMSVVAPDPATRSGTLAAATAIVTGTPSQAPEPAAQGLPIQPSASPAVIATPAKAEAVTDSAVSVPPQEQKIVALEDLPPDIRQEIPTMSISGFSYSEEPHERIVGINDRLLQEGQYLAQGLRLERIGRDGLVFSYKSYRFRKSLQ